MGVGERWWWWLGAGGGTADRKYWTDTFFKLINEITADHGCLCLRCCVFSPHHHQLQSELSAGSQQNTEISKWGVSRNFLELGRLYRNQTRRMTCRQVCTEKNIYTINKHYEPPVLFFPPASKKDILMNSLVSPQRNRSGIIAWEIRRMRGEENASICHFKAPWLLVTRFVAHGRRLCVKVPSEN